MKRSPNPKTYMIMAIGTLALGAVASYFGYSQMTGVEAEVAQLKGKVKDEKTVQQELDASKTKLEECAVQLKHLEQGVPDFAYVPSLMVELEKSGKKFGIQILGVRPIPKQARPGTKEDSAKAKKAYEELAIEVKGFGSYGSIMRFVNSLTEFPKIIAARSVSLTPKADPGATNTALDMVVELKAYVFADKAQATTTPANPTNPVADPKNPAKPGTATKATEGKTASLGVKRNEG